MNLWVDCILPSAVRVEVVGGGVVNGASSDFLSYKKDINTKISSIGRLADIINTVGDAGRF